MNQQMRLICTALALMLALGAGAQDIWPGSAYFFEKDDYADWTQAENQDQMTAAVWLTRADTRGLFNIVLEDEFDNSGYTSPLDTEWAVGDANNWAALSFDTWDNWHGADPSSMLGVPSVVHLISDDIYIDIEMVSWTSGGAGGGFSYYHGMEPTATYTGSWSEVKSLY
jgi:hypothetical protein